MNASKAWLSVRDNKKPPTRHHHRHAFHQPERVTPPTRWVTIVGHPDRAHFPAGISENSFYGDPPARLSDVVSKHCCAAEVLGSDGVAKVLKNPEQVSLINAIKHRMNTLC